MRINIKIQKVLRNCPVCLNSKGKVLHTQRFVLGEGNFLPASYNVVSCIDCGFVYADSSATQKIYDRHYRELSKYEDKKISSGGWVSGYDIKRLEKVAKDISKILPNKKAEILDVGSANGGLLLALKKVGYKNLTGLDPSLVCVKTMRGYGVKALHGGIFSKNLIKKKYDCIILSHVLEHIYDIRKAVKNSLNWLKEGGVLYLEVPDAAQYQNFFIVPYYFFDCEHINHFDKYSLENLFSQFSGKILKIKAKTIPVSEKELYPAVYVVFKKSTGKIPGMVKYSSKARSSVLKHIRQSRQRGGFKQIKQLIKSQKPVIVWGAGQFTQRLLQTGDLDKCNINGFVDNDAKKQGQRIFGRIIRKPDTLKTFQGSVVVCSALHSQKIFEQIRKDLKLNNEVIIIK